MSASFKTIARYDTCIKWYDLQHTLNNVVSPDDDSNDMMLVMVVVVSSLIFSLNCLYIYMCICMNVYMHIIIVRRIAYSMMLEAFFFSLFFLLIEMKKLWESAFSFFSMHRSVIHFHTRIIVYEIRHQL